MKKTNGPKDAIKTLPSGLPRPISNRLIVEPLEKKEELYAGKIIIPLTANTELEQGVIVALSDGFNAMFEIGEIVLYPTGAGTTMLIDKVTYKWLQGPIMGQLGDVWGIVPPEESVFE
jgi:co-chaperonin GroES (HSP10)